MLGGNKEKRSFYLVKWEKVKRGKRRRLGIKNLKIHNDSLLTKWLWRYGKEEGQLMEKAYTRQIWYTKSLVLWFSGPVNSSHGLGLWKHICSLWPSFVVNKDQSWKWQADEVLARCLGRACPSTVSIS